LREKINIVWYKRDIRTQDHEPLYFAEKKKLPIVLLYIFDPNVLQHEDSSERHHRFVYQSLMDYNSQLEKYKHRISIFYGDSTEIFNSILTSYDIDSVYSYQESGTETTWKIDRDVHALLKKTKVSFIELETDAVQRGLRSRKGWEDHWFEHVLNK